MFIEYHLDGIKHLKYHVKDIHYLNSQELSLQKMKILKKKKKKKDQTLNFIFYTMEKSAKLMNSSMKMKI